MDSFGNRNAVLSTPMIYDGLFMDMVRSGCNAVEIAGELRKAGNKLSDHLLLFQNQLQEIRLCRKTVIS